jgi:hypothetical protein
MEASHDMKLTFDRDLIRRVTRMANYPLAKELRSGFLERDRLIVQEGVELDPRLGAPEVRGFQPGKPVNQVHPMPCVLF